MRFRLNGLTSVAGLIVVVLVSSHAAEPSARFGIALNGESFPQAAPKETLGSVLKAVDLKRFDYLLAHLAHPDWVDERVKLYSGGFEELVRETASKFDPATVQQMQRFLQDGEIETLDTSATIRLKDVPDRVVRLRKVGERWFLRNDYKP